MPIAKLTKRIVDTIKPGDGRVIYYDTELKGFGLKVSAGGAKSWCVEYRPGARGRGIAKRRMVLASANTLTPEQARNAARDILARVALGEDPAASRSAAREMPNFREFAARYLAEEAEAKLKPRTVVNYEIYLRRHAIPRLGSLKLDKITSSEIAKMHRQVGQTTPMTANRVVECVSSVYRYATICGLIRRGHNPTSHIEPFREQRRERFLTTGELARLGDAIREAETKGILWEVDNSKSAAKHIPKNQRTIIGPHVAGALRLLILTGARLREILDLKWEHVDIERGLLFLPDSKTGRKTIVLNAPALAVLATLPRIGTYVIIGEHPETPRHDLKRPWQLVSKRAGLEGVRLHDLRHTHASFGAGAGLGLPIIGKLLGHTQPSTTQRYAHLDIDPLRRASETIGGRLAAAMGDLTTSQTKSAS
jgi:integrase